MNEHKRRERDLRSTSSYHNRTLAAETDLGHTAGAIKDEPCPYNAVNATIVFSTPMYNATKTPQPFRQHVEAQTIACTNWNPEIIRALKMLLPTIDITPPSSSCTHGAIREQALEFTETLPTRAAILLKFHAFAAGYTPKILALPRDTTGLVTNIRKCMQALKPFGAILAKRRTGQPAMVITQTNNEITTTDPVTGKQQKLTDAQLPKPAILITLAPLLQRLSQTSQIRLRTESKHQMRGNTRSPVTQSNQQNKTAHSPR